MRERLKNFILVSFTAIISFGAGIGIGTLFTLNWIVNKIIWFLQLPPETAGALIWQLQRHIATAVNISMKGGA